MENPPQRRFNFSVREMLFGMTAVGALLALLLQSGWWLGPTPFFQQFDPSESMRLALAKEGARTLVAGGRGRDLSGRVSCMRFEARCEVQGIAPTRAMELFRQQVELDLKANGAKIRGWRYFSHANSTNLRRFGYMYEDNWRKGELVAYLVPGRAGEIIVIGTVHEF